MNRALRIQGWKELRALLPWWAGGMVTLVAIGALSRLTRDWPWSPFRHLTIVIVVYVGTAAALGALAIGHEYSHRTLAATLARPGRRLRQLLIKYAVLGPLLAGLMGAAVWSMQVPTAVWAAQLPSRSGLSLENFYQSFFALLCGLCLAPWLSMASRGAMSGAVFAVALPFALIALNTSLGLDRIGVWWLGGGIGVVGLLMTVRTFLRLEVIEGSGMHLTLPMWLRRPMRDPDADTTRRRWLLLLRKELRLQQITFVCAGIYLLVWAVIVAARWIEPDNQYLGPSMPTLNSMFMAIIALMAGAQPAAEERQFGTAEWQHLLPGSGWRVWVLKCTVAIGLAVALGVSLPAVLAALQPAHTDVDLGDEVLVVSVLLTVTGLYVSSLATSGVRALLTSMPVLAVIALLGTTVITPLQWALGSTITDLSRRLVEAGVVAPPIPTLTFWTLAMAGLALLGVGLAYRNYRWPNPQPSRLTAHASILAGYMLLALTTANVLTGITWAARMAAQGR